MKYIRAKPLPSFVLNTVFGREKQSGQSPVTIKLVSLKIRKHLILTASVSLILLFLFSCGSSEESEGKVDISQLFPGESWALPMENMGPLEGSPGITARDCGNCHRQHYQEWSKSTHAHALSDIQFQSELAKPSSPEWLCLNCHIPVGNQRQEIVRYVQNGDILKPIAQKNPEFNPEMREEGVTCATCHLKKEDGRTVVIGPLGTGRAPHPVLVDRKALQNRCLDCHNVNYKVSSSLVCFFNSGNELSESNLSHKACSDCHMPSVNRQIVQLPGSFPQRLSHMHYFIGGGIPKEFDLLKFQDKGGYRSGLRVSLLDSHWDSENKSFRFTVEMRNLNTGHYLPTGDPERFIRIILTIFVDGKTVTRTYRLGQHWQWEPEATQLEDNRLKSGEVRVWQEQISMAKKPARLRLEAIHIRLNEKNAKYMEQTSARVPEPYRGKVARLRKFYPIKRILHSEDIVLPVNGQFKR